MKSLSDSMRKDLGLEKQIIVDNTRIAYSYICANWFGRPDKKLKYWCYRNKRGKQQQFATGYHSLWERQVLSEQATMAWR